MRIFKFWRAFEFEYDYFGASNKLKVFGGSNIDWAACKQDAVKRFEIMRAKIMGELLPDYEANIMEPIIAQIDTQNIVTRNRYHALVLNTQDVCFIDVDRYGRYGTFWEIISGKSLATRIQNHIERAIAQFPNYSFRIYQTSNGYRIMVFGRQFDPRGNETAALFKAFKSDRLYAMLCAKQNCFRARLTPKPYRLGIRIVKNNYPEQSTEELEKYNQFIAQYEAKSSGYATTKFIKDVGNTPKNKIVDLHDQVTQAHVDLPLA